MLTFLKKTKALIFIFSFSAISFPAKAHSPFLPPQVLSPYFTICPYNYSSICQTPSGNSCSLFAVSYQAAWFSTCLGEGFFYACFNLPTLPKPFVQNVCYLRGTTCTCAFGFINGYYIYEPGLVL